MDVPLQSGSVEDSGPILLVHGGAWDIPDAYVEAHRTGLDTVLEKGKSSLQQHDRAVLVVREAVTALELHEAFNAGHGAMLNQEGEAELDAGIMDGKTLEFGAVAATKRLAHPVRVAHKLLIEGEGRVRFLVAEGAERFARAQGIPLVSNDRLICAREQKRYELLRKQTESYHQSQSFLHGVANVPAGDTVGGVVRDTSGNVAAATSTGGTPFKPPGRVGDSPLPGSGFYADDHVAVSASGWGEAIATVGLARTVREFVVDGATAESAARKALSHLFEQVQSPDGAGATAGCIVVTDHEAAYAFTTPRMALGWCTQSEGPHCTVGKNPGTAADSH